MVVQADFPHLKEDIAALQDLQDFFAAQRLQAQPDPAGLRSVLRQIEALEASESDDDRTWGAWFAPWQRSLGVALPVMAVLALSGYMWQSQIPDDGSLALEIPATDSSQLVASRRAAVPAEAVLMMADFSETEIATEAVDGMDMSALAQSLSAEFASDLDDFETTRSELEPLYVEQLFSYTDSLNPSAL